MVILRNVFMLSFVLFGLVQLQGCSKQQSEPSELVQPKPISTPPALARIDDVVDTIHGVEVADPYRWLEDWEDQRVKSFSEEQNTHARKLLSALPERPGVHKRIVEILKGGGKVSYSGVVKAGEALFAMKSDPGVQQSMLVVLDPDADRKSERMLVDPNQIDDSGSTTIDWYKPSFDGRLMAVSMSKNGSEIGDLYIYNVLDGSQLGGVSKYVNGGTAGGDMAWALDNSGYYYTRYPYPGEKHENDADFYQRVFYHRIGDDTANDRYVIGDDFSKIAETRLILDNASGRLLVWVQDGDSNRFEFHLRQVDGKWQKFSEFGDGHIQAAFGKNNDIYVISQKDAPNGRVLVTSAAKPDLSSATVLIPETDAAIGHSFYSHFSPIIALGNERIYLTYQVGGPSEIRAFTLDGTAAATPIQLPVSTPFNVASADGSDIYFGNTSYVSASEWYHFNAKKQLTSKLSISSEPSLDYSDVDVVREFAKSKDGTMVPVNILLPKGIALDGTAAVVITGYGGYGASMRPSLSNSRHLLFENGVIFAEANLRGGGEFGAKWHSEGKLTKKQNVFDDFAAVIRHLVERKYAAADRVAIIGGSNGGLLMGATMVQNPELVAAVVSHVGIYDSVRSEFEPNGAFNIPEFGTITNPDHFAALYDYSPYHNIKDGVTYPPILLPTGANDPRVAPLHSRKFTARLQAAQNNQGTVLLRTSSTTGHGGGTPLDEVIELLADQYAFIFHYLGVQTSE
jgi:prolyl oligopeptidase